MTEPLMDQFGRKHDYLRISVTDRCNLRCIYCMGPEGVKFLSHEDILSYEEIIKVVEAALQLGISKIRLTGGEPLVRKGIEELVRQIAALPGITDMSMTTNGQLFAEKAGVLKKAGLKRINISLDSLNPQVYREITRGGELQKVQEAIEAALAYGFYPVKVNVVLMKGINDSELGDFLKLAQEKPIHLRFIEYMPMDSHDTDWKKKYLPLEAVKQVAQKMGLPLEPLDNRDCSGPAEMYQLHGTTGTIGLIHPVSGHFCSRCNRLRLTADGYLKPCLYWSEEILLRPYLKDPQALCQVIQSALKEKRARHQMDKVLDPDGHFQEGRGMSRIGG